MAASVLSRSKVDFGRAVLLVTDSVGLSPEGAFWITDAQEKRWKFYLVTSLFDIISGRELYTRLYDVLAEKLSLTETADFTLYIAGPDEALVDEVRKTVTTKETASYPNVIKITLDGRASTLVVYRMAERLKQKSAQRAERVFRKLSDEFVPA